MKDTLVVSIALSLVGLALAQSRSGPVTAADLLKDPAIKAALDGLKAGEPQVIEDQIRFCEVAAPPFHEGARGEVLRQAFQQLGLRNVRMDSVGNVLGDRPGASPRPRMVLGAHLDTVFPEGTDVRVRRDGTVLRGPGIG